MQWGHHSLHRKQLLALLLFSALYGINLLVSMEGKQVENGSHVSGGSNYPHCSIIFFFLRMRGSLIIFSYASAHNSEKYSKLQNLTNADVIFFCQDYNQNVWYFVPCKLSFGTEPSGPDTAAHLHLIRSHKDDDLWRFLWDCFGQTRSLPFGISTSGQSLVVEMFFIWFGHNTAAFGTIYSRSSPHVRGYVFYAVWLFIHTKRESF